MPIPNPTITQTSSLVSIVNETSSFTESVAEFEEYIRVPLGYYFYSMSSKAMVKIGRKRIIYQGGFKEHVTDQIIWTQ